MTAFLTHWIDELERHQQRCWRYRGLAYQQAHDAHARRLTAADLRACRDRQLIATLERILREARYCTGFGRMHAVWTRAELGVLIAEATNRGRQLALGEHPRQPGPRLDPARIPDDRLDHLIQRHRDLAVVEALRDERERRAGRTARAAA